jgi:cellulose synthase/poly-beta-1,6-N-acetylglucosamine synthase-like glycosyltransferase
MLPHLRGASKSPPYELPSGENLPGPSPTVTILLPLHKEKSSSIRKTVDCLRLQDYSRVKIRYVIEPEDAGSFTIPPGETRFDEEMLMSDGRLKLKAHAMNAGLAGVESEIVAVYDAGDTFPSDQVSKAVALMREKQYDLLQPKILRKSGRSLVSAFLEIDSFVWTRKFVPFYKESVSLVPLSGEGLFVRKSLLDTLGGYPEVLTEDAYLSILAGEKKARFGLLDSTIVEDAPKNLASHFRQRVRWFRGYLTCARKLVRSRLPLKSKIFLATAFFSPITTAFSLLTWAFFFIYWVTFSINTKQLFAPWMTNPIYGGLFYFSLAMLLANFAVIFSSVQSLVDTEEEKKAPIAILQPLYWIFLGVASFASFFRGTKVFGRTERE